MSTAAIRVRPAEQRDLKDLMDLAVHAGSGMTTMPQTERVMSHRIYRSQEAFIKPEMPSHGETFFLVLEVDHKVVGTCSIFTRLGDDRPFYSYRMSHISSEAPELKIRSDTDILYLVNDYHGFTEIGTLFIHPDYRKLGVGRLLSFSRFMLMAAHPGRFGDRVMAEIRGWTDKNGDFPFWEHVGKKFFGLDFDEADRRSTHDFRFIADLMPKYPIYTALLPSEAQAVLGKPHDSSLRAMEMLQSEGFRYEKLIDIFDGGPSVEARIADVKTINRARPGIARTGNRSGKGIRTLVARTTLDRFICIQTYLAKSGASEVSLSKEQIAMLEVDDGTEIIMAEME